MSGGLRVRRDGLVAREGDVSDEDRPCRDERAKIEPAEALERRGIDREEEDEGDSEEAG